MADISGVGNSFNPSAATAASAGVRGQDDERSLLEQLREELREEARVAAREAAQAEATGNTNGVTAPDPLNRFVIERSTPNQDEERPRGFQPEDIEDRVEISQEARDRLAESEDVRTEQLNASAFTNELVTDTRENNAEVNEREADQADFAVAASNDEEDSLAQEEVEAAEAQEFVAEINAVIADDDASSDYTVAIDEDVEDSASQVAANIVADQTDDADQNVLNDIAENDENVVNFQSEQQAINAETVVREDETNQVAANENDTAEVNGNRDQANPGLGTQTPGDRVLGQIVDQFA